MSLRKPGKLARPSLNKSCLTRGVHGPMSIQRTLQGRPVLSALLRCRFPAGTTALRNLFRFDYFGRGGRLVCRHGVFSFSVVRPA